MTPCPIATAVVAFVLATGAADQRPSRPDARRIRPPAGIDCPPNRLTVYTGSVARLTREPGRTIVDIRTDWDTTEQAVVRHAVAEGPDRWFRLGAKPFGPDDWQVIEIKPGQLRPGVRASAWVCDNGTNPVIDWNPAAEPPPGG